MKRREVPQQKTIIAMTPEEWDERVNGALAKMLDDTRSKPEIIERTKTSDGGYMAIIQYWKEYQEPECIRDEFHLKGVVYRCDDCPHLRRSTDKRIKWLECGKGMYETTKGSSEACDWFYEQVYKGMKEDIKND